MAVIVTIVMIKAISKSMVRSRLAPPQRVSADKRYGKLGQGAGEHPPRRTCSTARNAKGPVKGPFAHLAECGMGFRNLFDRHSRTAASRQGAHAAGELNPTLSSETETPLGLRPETRECLFISGFQVTLYAPRRTGPRLESRKRMLHRP